MGASHLKASGGSWFLCYFQQPIHNRWSNDLDFTAELTLHCSQQRWQLISYRKLYHPCLLLENYFSSTIICQFCLLIFSYHQPPYLQKSFLLDAYAQLQNNLLRVTHAYQRQTGFMQKLMAVYGSCYISLYNICHHCCHSMWIASSFVNQNEALEQCEDYFCCCSDNKVLPVLQW